jgi:hypothetical protein
MAVPPREPSLNKEQRHALATREQSQRHHRTCSSSPMDSIAPGSQASSRRVNGAARGRHGSWPHGYKGGPYQDHRSGADGARRLIVAELLLSGHLLRPRSKAASTFGGVPLACRTLKSEIDQAPSQLRGHRTGRAGLLHLSRSCAPPCGPLGARDTPETVNRLNAKLAHGHLRSRFCDCGAPL